MKKIIISFCFYIVAFASYGQDIPKWKITDVEKLVNAKNGEVLVLNFWATFCKPCVAEIPAFIEAAGKYKSEGVKLFLISLDLPSYYPSKIKTFAAKYQFNTNISWLDETNADYFCPKVDSGWSGSIPATLIVNTKTGYRFFTEGEMKAEIFEAELKKAISK
ncbi:MAG: TlpA family protein disulfide reductase [Ferruginibacter sp.]|nr:TlpA family protein disulfide reductase [Ferruginibacter sp.]